VAGANVVIMRVRCAIGRAPGIAAALILSTVCAASPVASTPRFTGAFSGTGRACYGRLYVRTKTISWLTTFSQCQKVPYGVLEQHENGNERRFAFQLERRSKGCRFAVIYLYHRDNPDQDMDWQVIGYESIEDYRADQAQGFKADAPTALSCYLVTE
jgi:hypothetical protein